MLTSRWNKIFQQSWFSPAVLTTVCFLIYGHILNAPYQFDDYGLLMRNPNIESLPYFFQNWQVLQRKALTFLTFAINYKIAGHDPFGYHLVNVILHIFTSWFVYLAVINLLKTAFLKDTVFAKEKKLFALFVSLIFAVHPLQTQSVTYIWQRSEVLSGFFYLLAYWLYIKGRNERKYGYFALTGLFFYTGFFVKGTVVSLPILIVLTEVYFFAAPRKKKLIAIFSAGAIGIFILSLFFNHPFRILFEKFHLGFLVRNSEEMKWDYMWTQFKVLWVYIRLAFFPVNQSVDYYFPIVRPYPDLSVAMAFLGLVIVFFTAIKLYDRERLMSFGIFWFFIYLLPTSFIYLLVDPIFEHRVYVSMAGFSLFLVSWLFRVLPDPQRRNKIIMTIILILGVLTVARNNLWRSPTALMEDAIKKAPLNHRPYLNLGTYFYRQGNVDRAAFYYEKVLALKPYSAELYNNLGLIYRDKGDSEKALAMFEKAISINPELVLGLLNLAYLAMDKGALKDAEEYLNRAFAIEQSDKVYTARGFLWLTRRNMERAEQDFLTALKYNPGNPKTYFGLGNVYFTRHDYPRAVEMYQKTLALEPFFSAAEANLMRLYYDMGDFDRYRQIRARRENLQK